VHELILRPINIEVRPSSLHSTGHSVGPEKKYSNTFIFIIGNLFVIL
jgi:hypothetical protein